MQFSFVFGLQKLKVVVTSLEICIWSDNVLDYVMCCESLKLRWNDVLVHRIIALDVLCIGQMCSKHLLSYRMAEHGDHFIGPEESAESVYDHGHVFGVEGQQNVPPPNQQFFEFM